MRWLGFAGDTPPQIQLRVSLVVASALLAISSSATLVKGMQGIDPLAIAAWRTLGATCVLLPLGISSMRKVSGGDLARMIAAGAALALHFWSWFASLSHTTALRSTLLVCTVPVFTAPLEWLLLGERPRRSFWIGCAVALPGVAMLADDEGSASLLGDALALFAALLWSAYFLLGRSVRQRVDAAATMAIVCSSASVMLFLAAFASGAPLWGYSGGTWLRIGLAIAGPQLIGHQGLVYAVRWLPASTISALTLLEPVGSAMFAAALLGEIPTPQAILGSCFVLLGIAAATRP